MNPRPAARAWFAVLAMVVCVVAPCASWLARIGGLGWLPPHDTPVATAAPIDPLPAPPLLAAPHNIIASPAVLSDGNRQPASAQVDFARPDYADRMPLPGAAAASPAIAPGAAPFATFAGWIAGGLWLAMSLALAVRLLCDVVAALRMARAARPCLQEPILQACQRAACRLGLPGAPAVAYSAGVNCPTVLAWGRPQILIPEPPRDTRTGGGTTRKKSNRADAENEHRWYAIFCHELGHLRRGDGWSGLAVEVMTALLPWQPLLWLLRAEFRRSCEEACDDWALFSGVDPLDYAATLAEWIPHRPPAVALGIGNRRHPICRRIDRLLSATIDRRPQLSPAGMVSGAGIATMLALALALFQAGTEDDAVGDDMLARAMVHAALRPGAGVESPADGDLRDLLTPTIFQSRLGEARLKHWNYAAALGFVGQGRSALSAGRDGVVQVWNLQTGHPQATFVRPHTAAALSGDGRRLFLARADGAIEVADSTTGELCHRLELRLPQATGYLPSLLASNRDGTIAACGGRYATAHQSSDWFLVVWDVRSQKPQMTICGRQPEWTLGASAGWHCLALSRDGTRLAAGGLHYITCWDTQTGEQLHKLAGEGRIYALAFSDDGQTLASGDAQGLVQLWDAASGRQQLRLQHRATISAVVFHPEGRRLLTSAGSSVQLWDTRAAASLWEYDPPNGPDRTRPFSGGLYFSGDGQQVVFGAANRLVLLDADTGAEAPLAGQPLEPDCTAVSIVSGGRVLTGDADGRVSEWQLVGGALRRTSRQHASAVRAMAVSSDGQSLATRATDGSLVLWNPEDLSVRHTRRESLLAGIARAGMAFSADGATLAATTRRQSLLLWDVETASQRDEVRWPAEELSSSKGELLLGMWLAGSETELPEVGQRDRKYPGFQMAVSANGRYAAGGTYGGRLELWDRQTEQKIEIDAHAGRLQALVYSPDSAWLASAGEDGRVCFWDPRTGRRLACLTVGPPGGVIRDLAVSSDGRFLATLNGNGTVDVYRTAAK